MSDVNDLRAKLAQARAGSANAANEIALKREELRKLKREAAAAARLGAKGAQRAAELDAKAKSLASDIEGKQKQLGSLKANLSAQLHQLTVLADPTKQIESLSAKIPILLFPVRLETRFRHDIVTEGRPTPQLWIRIYPDDCQIDGFEQILTEGEVADATAFWAAMWRAGGFEPQERGAWRAYAGGAGSGRAAYVIAQFKPDLAKKPAKAKAEDVILVIVPRIVPTQPEQDKALDYWTAVWKADGDKTQIDSALNALRLAVGDAQADAIQKDFAPEAAGWDPPKPFKRANITLTFALLELPPAPPTKSGSWTQAPKAAALPDRFVALLYNGGAEVRRVIGLPVQDGLAVAPDPSLPAGDQLKVTNDDLELNDDLRWIADFERAVAVGMGLKIDLSPTQAQNGFERLIVVGLRISSDELASKKLLEDLIAHQHASKAGYSLVPQGSPTNNTESGGAAYTWADDPDTAYDSIFKGADAYAESSDPLARRDGQWLAEALGIDGALLKRVPNANHTDQAEARAMNVALWNGTAGYMLEEMMTPLFSRADIAATRLFFTNNVLGRGPLPAVRVGRQPYGILPALTFSRYRSAVQNNDLVLVSAPNYLQRLHALLTRLDADWKTMSGKAAHVGQSGGDPHQTLLDIVGLHSGSVEYYQRYAKSFEELYNKLVLEDGLYLGAALAVFIAQYSHFVLTGLGADPNLKPPILEKFFYGASHLLSGPLVDDTPLSEAKQIRVYSADNKNYVEWLASASHDAIRRQDFGGKPAPNSLLYLMLRHSMMLAHWDTGLRFLEVRGFVDPAVVRLEPAFIHVQTAQPAVQSKFERLYQTAPSITGNNTTTLAEHMLLPAVLFGTAETESLREIVAALKVLANAPTARLERVFAEHIDCCSYRLDAWKTALATARLREMRTQTAGQGPRPGIHLGAFGWLENLKPKTDTLQPVKLTGDLAKTFQRPGDAPLKHDTRNEGYIHAPSLNHAAAAAILKNAYANSATPANPDAMAVNLSSDRVRQALAILEGIRNGQTLAALLGYRFERGLHDAHNLAEVDKFIYPLRQAFPLASNKLKSTRTDGTVDVDLIEARNVIDGVAFVQRLRTVKAYPFGLTVGTAAGNVPVATNDEKKAINIEADRLLNLHDAVGDLVMAESIYQVVLGNFDRAAANTQAFSEGHHPPETQIVNTPRSGLSLTHRVALHLDPTANPAVSPSAVPMTPRAAAEAPLNLWLAGRMPAPADVAVSVTYTTPMLAAPKTVTLSQADLALQPLDVIYLFNLDLEQAMAELDDRIVQALRYGADGHPDLAATVNYTVPVAGKVSFFELAALVRSLRAVLLKSRTLGPTDMTLPFESASGEEIWNDAELAARVTGAIGGLTPHRDALVLLKSDASDLDAYAQAVSDRLLRVALYGLPRTGTGQIHGDIRAIYDAIVAKVRAFTDRWQKNAGGYVTLLATWPTLATDEERFALLRKAEALVSATLTPVPDPDPDVHRAAVDLKKGQFDAALAQFQALLAFGGKLVDFATAATAMGPVAAPFDTTAFDIADQQAAIVALRATIVQRVTALADDLTNRITAATAAVTAAAKLATSKARVAALLAAAKSVLGDEFVLVPRFLLGDERGTEFKNAFDGSAALLTDLKAGGRRLPVDDWFYGAARVRGKLNALENAYVLSEAFGAAPAALTPVQLPFVANDRWMALEFDTANAGRNERLLYTGHFAVAFNSAAEQCALLLDEWPELVPATDVMSGVTFQFDRPNSEPPQTMLLALPSAPAENWHWDDLIDTLRETLDNARLRAVEPANVDQSPYAHFLPATLTAVTLHQITIATNYAVNNAIYDKIGSQ